MKYDDNDDYVKILKNNPVLHYLTCITGMIWAEVKEIWSQGPGEYLVEPWNFLDFGMLAIFLASFSCRFSALRHADIAQTFVYSRYTTLINVTLPPEINYFTLGEHVHTPAD